MQEKEAFIEEFKKRTKAFTLRNIKVFQSLPKTDEAKIIGKQLLVLQVLSGLITEQFAEQEAKLIFLQN
jgi:hypothetical protein